jgi:hypothetical protein
MKLATMRLHAIFLGSALMVSFAARAELSWNGFGSAFYGQALNRQLLPPGFDNTRPNFTAFSLMGLNLGASIAEGFDFAAQLVALGDPVGVADSFGLISQWAYVNYKPTHQTSLRLGRQLFPPLLASEYVRIGYLLPFRQIPNNVFNLLPFTRFDGASVYQSLDVGVGSLTVGAFGGKALLDINSALLPGLVFTFDNLVGAQATLDGTGWRVRAQVSRFLSRLQTSTPFPASDRSGVEYSYSVGYRFDRFNVVSWGEYIGVRTPDGTDLGSGKYADRGYAFYWLGGYRIGKLMPRYTFAKGSQNYNVTSNGSSMTHTLGLNYQAGQQLVVKAEYERDIIPNAQGGGYFVTQPGGATETSGDAFYLGVDFIF